MAVAAAFLSWALLLPVVPLDVLTSGGSDALAGSTTAIFMGCSVLTQWNTPRALRRFGFTQRFSCPNWRTQKNIATLGWAIGLSYFLEASLFTFIVWLIADLGENDSAR